MERVRVEASVRRMRTVTVRMNAVRGREMWPAARILQVLSCRQGGVVAEEDVEGSSNRLLSVACIFL